IDPVSGPVDQADFEMKTREMTAVDLEALGLSDASISSSTLPAQRISSSGIESTSDASALEVRFRKRDGTDPVEDVDVDVEGSLESLSEGLADGGTTLDQEDDAGDDESADVPEVDSSEFSTIDPADAEPVDALPEDFSRIRPPVVEGRTATPSVSPPAIPFRNARAPTVALSEDDLEEMREVARASTQPPARPMSAS